MDIVLCDLGGGRERAMVSCRDGRPVSNVARLVNQGAFVIAVAAFAACVGRILTARTVDYLLTRLRRQGTGRSSRRMASMPGRSINRVPADLPHSVSRCSMPIRIIEGTVFGWTMISGVDGAYDDWRYTGRPWSCAGDRRLLPGGNHGVADSALLE